ncbi:MAG: endonuclease V [Planctomycetaceae bacterium]
MASFVELLDCDLRAELTSLLVQIPAGRVSTYGALADALGDRVAARWVGEFLLDHPHGPDCVCHRVVRRNGDPGLYIAGDAVAKLGRLATEGVPISDGRVVLDRPFTTFTGPATLRRLTEFQNGVRSQLDLRTLRRPIQRVAALDVAYLSPCRALAACAVFKSAPWRLMQTHEVETTATFPYISGYLAFRELPALLELWRHATADISVDLAIIDGNGILHPRRAGIAACFGLLADVPTIGIGKSLLCGSVDLTGLRAGATRPIIHCDEMIGLAVRSTNRSRPIFVSPGNHCDLSQPAEIVQDLFAGHRLPEPLHQADRLTKQRVREIREVRCQQPGWPSLDAASR